MTIDFLQENHFEECPKAYDAGWIFDSGKKNLLLRTATLQQNIGEEEQSWSSEMVEIIRDASNTGWCDAYERKRVHAVFEKLIAKNTNNCIVDFGAGEGYMAEEMYAKYAHNTTQHNTTQHNTTQHNTIVATDLFSDGLIESCKRNPNILHLQCDFTDAPFKTESVDLCYSLNVLEHIADDEKAISECYRILKHGAYCLFVVPRGEKLYDYYDEANFHKRRYAKAELRRKCENAHFTVVENFHFAWLCYPAFWLKKKYNQWLSKKLSAEQKLQRTDGDLKNAGSSPLGTLVMQIENILSTFIKPSFGIREFILCKKE